MAAAWQTEVLTPPAMAGSMALVTLPFAVEATREAARAVRTRIWHEHRIEVPIMAFGDRCHARISAQIYNEPADYHRLADIFRR